MAIILNDNLQIRAPKPPDDRMQRFTIAERNAIGYRWAGMLVYVEDIGEGVSQWQFLNRRSDQDLSSNNHWSPIGSSVDLSGVVLQDGSTAFLAPQKGKDPIDDEDLVTKGWVTAQFIAPCVDGQWIGNSSTGLDIKIRDIRTSGDGAWFAVGTGEDSIVHSMDNGETWSYVDTGFNNTWDHVETNDQGIWMIGSGVGNTLASPIIISNDGGITWSLSTLASPGVNDIVFLGNTSWLAVGTIASQTYISHNNGTTWDIVNNIPYIQQGFGLNNLKGGASDKNGTIVLTHPTSNALITSQDNGQNWEIFIIGSGKWKAVETNGNGIWIAIADIKDPNVFINDGKVAISTNNGEDWDIIQDLPDIAWQDIATDEEGKWKIIGADFTPVVLSSDDNGSTWTVDSPQLGGAYYSIDTDKNGLWLIGAFQGVNTFAKSELFCDGYLTLVDLLPYVKKNGSTPFEAPQAGVPGVLPNHFVTLGQIGDLIGEQGKRLISGGFQWTGTGYVYESNVIRAFFDGIVFEIEPLEITLPPGDDTYDRVDVFVINDQGIVYSKQGIPSANPLFPDLSEDEVFIQEIIVKANTTQPDLNQEIVYAENQEWTTSLGGITNVSVSFDSQESPYNGQYHIRAENVTRNTQIIFTKENGDINTEVSTTLAFRIRVMGPMQPNSRMRVRALYGGNQVGNYVDSSTYGFVAGDMGVWQLIILPTADFNVQFLNGLEFTMINAPNVPLFAEMSWDMDDIILSDDLLPPVVDPTLITIYSNGNEVASTSNLNFVDTPTAEWDVEEEDGKINVKVNVIDTSSPTGKYIVSGGAVWSGEGLKFLVNVTYNYFGLIGTINDEITLNNGDSSFARFDLIAIEVNEGVGSLIFIEGVPSEDPYVPSIEENQIGIQPVLVSANASTPDIAQVLVYSEATQNEWVVTTYNLAGSPSGTIDIQNTNAPYSGQYCIKASLNPRRGLDFRGFNPIVISDYPVLVLFFRSPVPLTSDKLLAAYVGTGGTRIGNVVNFMAYGLDRNKTSWQQVVIPTALFGAGDSEIDTIRIRMDASTQAETEFYLDFITFSSGAMPATPPDIEINVLQGGTLKSTTGAIDFVDSKNAQWEIEEEDGKAKVKVNVEGGELPEGIVLADGTIDFTAPQAGVDPVKLNDLATYRMIQGDNSIDNWIKRSNLIGFFRTWDVIRSDEHIIITDETYDVLVSHDNGLTWARRGIDPWDNYGLHSIAIDNTGKIIGTTDMNKTLHVSTDFGESWSDVYMSTLGGTERDIIFSNDVWFIISNNALYTSINGTTWSMLLQLDGTAATMAGSNGVMVITTTTTTYRTIDNWGTHISESNSLTGLVFSDRVNHRGNVFVRLNKTNTNTLHVTKDTGITWNKVTLPTSATWVSIQPISEQEWILIDDGSNVFRSVDGCINWTADSALLPGTYSQRGLVIFADLHILIVTQNSNTEVYTRSIKNIPAVLKQDGSVEATAPITGVPGTEPNHFATVSQLVEGSIEFHSFDFSPTVNEQTQFTIPNREIFTFKINGVVYPSTSYTLTIINTDTQTLEWIDNSFDLATDDELNIIYIGTEVTI